VTDAKVIDRVLKLLRLAESSNVHEAAVAAARAQALMERHRIDAAVLEAGEGPNARDPVRDEPDAPLESGTRLPRWRLMLATTLAELGGCRAYLRHQGDGRRLVLVGTRDDAAAVRTLHVHLVAELDRLTRTLGRGRGRRWCTGFRLGAVTTLCERLRAARRDARRQAQTDAARRLADGESTALVRLGAGLQRLEARQREVDTWMAEHLDLRQRGPRTVRADADGFERGRAAGHAVDLRARAALHS
jgi:hypothetical protein